MTKSRVFTSGMAIASVVLCTLLLSGALALTFESVVTAKQGDISGRYDVYRYYGPVTFYLDYCLSQGEWPLWNPLVYCGLPNSANPQSFVFYPWNLLRSVMLTTISPQSTAVSMIVFMAIHLLLMGVFTFLLARSHKMSFAGALTAALVWTCSALMVRRAAEYHFFYTITWLPLLLLLVKNAMDTRSAWMRTATALSAGLLLGIAILGGFLQIVNYMGVSIGVYAFFYRILFVADPALGRFFVPTRRFTGECMLFVAMLLIAGCTAAVLLLPTTELAAFSARQKGTAVPMYSDLMSWTLTRLYQSIVVFPGMKWEVETLRGAGITVLLLAAASLFNKSRRTVALFGLMGYALVDCGFGPPFPIASLVNLLTPFSSSAYSRGFDFALLPLGLLAGLGVDSFLRQALPVRQRVIRAALVTYVAAATVIPLYQWVFPAFFLPVTLEVIIFPLVALGFLVLFSFLPLNRRWGAVLLLVLPGLLFAETWSWNRHYIPWMIAHFKGDRPPIQEGHHFPTVNQRYTDPIPNRGLYSLRPVMNGVDPLHFAAVRDVLSGTPRDRGAFRLVADWEPTAENSRGNLLFKRFFWLSREVSIAPLPGKGELFPSATTVFLDENPVLPVPVLRTGSVANSAVSPEAVRVDIPETEKLFALRSTGNQLRHTLNIRVPDSLDGIEAGSSGTLHGALVYRFLSEGNVQLDTTFDDTVTGRSEWGLRHRIRGNGAEQTVQVPLPDMRTARANITVKPSGRGNFQFVDAYLLIDPADEDRYIGIERISANEVRLNIAALPGPRILSYLDAWYPGWKAYVDGVETHIHTANDVFKAIEIPEGAHDVRFVFSPRSTRNGAVLSLSTFVFVSLLVFYCLFRARREHKVLEQFAPAASWAASRHSNAVTAGDDEAQDDSGVEFPEISDHDGDLIEGERKPPVRHPVDARVEPLAEIPLPVAEPDPEPEAVQDRRDLLEPLAPEDDDRDKPSAG